MHTPKVAICILGCLVAQEIDQRVSATPAVKLPENEASQLASSQRFAAYKPVVSVAPPESFQLHQLTLHTQLSSASSHNTQVSLRDLPDSLSVARPEVVPTPFSANTATSQEVETNKSRPQAQEIKDFVINSHGLSSTVDLVNPPVEKARVESRVTSSIKESEPLSQLASEATKDSKSLISEPFSAQAFSCERLDRTYKTVLAGTKTPLIHWRSQEFSSSGYTPERRCKQVTNKLNKIVFENGSRLSDLWLTMGQVGSYRVLCQVNSTRSGCNRNNLLMTLSYWNRRKPEEVIARLLSFAVVNKGKSVQESSGQTYINLEQWVNQRIKTAKNPRLSASDSKYWEGILADDLGEP